MDGENTGKKLISDLLIDWFSRYQDLLSDLIVTLGVPEAQRPEVLKTLTIIVPVVVLFFVFGLLLLVLKKTGKKAPPPEEITPSVEEEPGEAAGEDVGGPSEAEAEVLSQGLEPSVAVPETEVEVPPAEPVSIMGRMRAGLAKTQAAFVGRLDELVRGGRGLDDRLWEDLEEVLITADVGMKTTLELRESLEKRQREGKLTDSAGLRAALREEIKERLNISAEKLDFAACSPFVLMVIGVNGVGKTTTIGKLAHSLVHQEKKKVILGACDTFRAAAVEQLGVWAERAGADIISHGEGADPAGVAFDTIKAAIARQADVVILDTAGRLHTKVNLMEEVKKIRRVVDRELPGAPHETLLVLDATLGQNSLIQARLFQEAVEVSGLALTKLDGTARGGMIVAIGNELNLPVRFVGIGEKVEDLRPFDPEIFVEALFEIA
ncbi:MAG: signal recognition particle-docking protein FtsY [Deltaproteobacteria bacterium]|nr:signal recognition particle-docking protein FtsY [Deltaproteobacteria bacterium]